jgi:predicted amidohydrolase YtcJ
MTGLLLRDCRVEGYGRVDARIADGVITEIGPRLEVAGADVLDGNGGALLPGLHDHHIHLHACAAALLSVDCGPDSVRSANELAGRLRTAATRGAVRGVGYHESVAGLLDRVALDAIISEVPVRIQHRSGRGWFLNTAALQRYGLDANDDPAVERDGQGDATGRVWRGDYLLRDPAGQLPGLDQVGRALSRYGVTGVTDATPDLTPPAVQALRSASAEGALPQRLRLLGAPIGDSGPDVGPFKVVLDEEVGLDVDGVVDVVRRCRAVGRAVAFHAVTAAEAVVAVTALRAVGPSKGDRLEHGSVLPHELDRDLVDLALVVVTQPTFVSDRGDDYLRDVDERDRPLLYRCRSLLDAGIGVAAGSDAPYGNLDPWRAVAAATTRRTRAGAVLGPDERLPARRALDLFLGSPADPAGAPRRVRPGALADLCLLDGPLADVLQEPAAERVVATVIGGEVVHRG